MGTIQSFKDLIVWQKAHKVVLEIYAITKKFPLEEKYGLGDQLRRASVSITSNIAEGFVMRTAKDKNRFYLISKGSTSECMNQIIIAYDLGYIKQNERDILDEALNEIMRMLSALIKSSMTHSLSTN